MRRKHTNLTQNQKSENAANAKVTTSRRIAPLSPVKVGPNILGSKITKKVNVNCLSHFRKTFRTKKGIVNEIAKASDDDSSEEHWNQFFSEFEKLMCEEEEEASD